MIVKKFLSEHFELIKSHCYIGGNILLSAPTGVGKTYTFLNVGKEIIKETDGEFVFIFATPTRVQSEQNGSNYNVYTVISGVNDFRASQVNTVVYDKLNVILDNKHLLKGKKIIFVVDEAHELIYSKKYRKKALSLIKELSDMAYTTIHTTATPRGLEYIYKYDDILRFSKLSDSRQKVNLILDDEPLKMLTNLISQNLTINKKMIININDKNSITHLEEILKRIFENKKISVYTSESKDDSDFRYLIEHNKLRDDIDLALCTNILNAGINIKNNDIELIYYTDSNKWNLDLIQQFAGRTRNNNSILTIIAKRAKEEYRNDNQKTLEDIYKDWFQTLINRKRAIEKYYCDSLEFASKNNFEFSFEGFEAFFKTFKYEEGKDKLNTCLQFDDANILSIDKEKLIEMTLNKFDSQILYLNSIPKIIETLSSALNSDVELLNFNEQYEQSEEIATKLKQSIADRKKETKELKQKIYETFVNFDEENRNNFTELLKMKILHEDKIIIESFKKSINKEVVELFEKIEQHHNLLDKFSSVYRVNSNINPHCLSNFISSKFNNDVLMAIRYKHFNNIFSTLDVITPADARLIGQDYLTIRKTLEPHIQKNISLKQLTNLYNAINTPSKQVSSYKEISSKNLERFMFKISCIFNIKLISNRYFISSLCK